MKNVLVCILLRNTFDTDRVSDIISKTKSDMYNVKTVLFDMTDDEIRSEEYLSIDIIRVEDKTQKGVENHVLELIKKHDTFCFTKIECSQYTSVEPIDGYIDMSNLDMFDDQNIGCIFSDNYVSGVIKHKKSFPVELDKSRDIYFLSSLSFTENWSESRDVEDDIISSTISRYLPIPTYKI